MSGLFRTLALLLLTALVLTGLWWRAGERDPRNDQRPWQSVGKVAQVGADTYRMERIDIGTELYPPDAAPGFPVEPARARPGETLVMVTITVTLNEGDFCEDFDLVGSTDQLTWRDTQLFSLDPDASFNGFLGCTLDRGQTGTYSTLFRVADGYVDGIRGVRIAVDGKFWLLTR
ncbi:hypothetical protein B0O41_1464 [Propionibacteriaceae bacterium ES.041]|uniref:hypothetical protein n=1 Tax=Enemella evansiae TaxID=2016499 RepID=UPI000B96F05A|nr:hypothetical protein [Enemella evansiae]OYN93763.1 hypothetical protein CGZ96_20405 [Enemella evansiae]PFG66670.1 hypothetical protein B0O41_1464 [Propionibacteriaceae bacterium ES.041]